MAAGPAGAGAADLTALGSEGAWSVVHGYDPGSGAAWCEAETVNGAGQRFGVSARDDGGASVYVGDASWASPPRVVRFSIDIDDKRWSIEGAAGAGAVAVPLEGNASAGWFLHELAEGDELAVVEEDGRALGAFSLAGARGALGQLAQCWARILPREIGQLSDET